MLKEIQVSLYEIFGYLVPGMLFMAALFIFYWSICVPLEPAIISNPSNYMIGLSVFCAYICGHLAQAVSNHVSRILSFAISKGKRPGWMKYAFASVEWALLSEQSEHHLPPGFLMAIKIKMEKFGILPEQNIIGTELSDGRFDIKEEWIYRACDEAVVQRGKLGDREIFVYREGFYRGLWISFLLIFVALLIRCVRRGALIIINKSFVNANASLVPFFLVLSASASLLCYFRYRRFGRYRVSQALLGFLALPEEKKEKNKGTEEKKGDD